MTDLSLIKILLPLIPELIRQDFPVSSEGSTSKGIHETAVANFFVAAGLPLIGATVTIKSTNARSKKEKTVEMYIMNRYTHEPTKGIQLPYSDGAYTILQPYSKDGRGAMTPSPDIYIVYIRNKRIVEWLGNECKSSKSSLCPMWNEHLPRAYKKGNILYFFTGYDKVSKKKINTLFTSEIFSKGQDGSKIEDTFWPEVRAFMMAKWAEEYAKDFPMVECKLRQFCGQTPFSPEEMVRMVEDTTAFLSSQI